MIYLSIICLALVAALIVQSVLHSKERRENERAWRLERTGLLTRIQAPEAASFIVDTEEEVVQHVPFDDDKAFEAAQEEVPSWP